MLPSTGYFKAINCPFYENGSCDRPYCHFKHSKREDAVIVTETAETLESHTNQIQEPKATTVQSDSVLQQLVTEAVKKVLANQDVTTTDQFSCQNVVSRVVEGLKPTLTSGNVGKLEIVAANVAEKGADVPPPINKPVPCVYNPTPIAELKKRHIPIISYMPTRESRVAVKRKCSPEGVKSWLSNELTDTQTVEAKYKPTTIVNVNARDNSQSYVPTCKVDPVLSSSLDDGNSSDYAFKLGDAYYPRSKKRREEYVPKKIKAPLTSIEGLKDSVTYNFTPGFDKTNQPATNASRSPTDFDSNAQSHRFYSDLEPKFSDDDDDGENEEEEHVNEENENDIESNLSKVNGEDVDNGQDIIELYDDSASGYSNHEQHTIHTPTAKVSVTVECVNKENRDEKDSKDKKVSTTRASALAKEILKTSQCEKRTSLETDASKTVDKNLKEHKYRREDKAKHEKNHNSRKRSKEKRRVSTEKSHSTSRGSSKDEARDSKSKNRDKDKHREKSQEKHRYKERTDRNKERNESKHRSKSSRRNSRDSEKHRGDRDSSGSSKKEERVKKRRDGSKRSNLSDKSEDDKKTLEEFSAASTENNEGLIERLGSRFDSTRSKLDEENDDRLDDIISIDIDDVILSGSDSDHDVQEECLKIFQEYQVSERSKSTVSPKESPAKQEEERNEDLGRKRVAHPSAATCVTRSAPDNQRPKKVTNPQLKMYERWRSVRDTVAEKAASVSNNVPLAKDAQRRNNVEAAARIRIAHVPYAKSLAIEKKKMTENVGKSTNTKTTDGSKTAAQTAKSGVRVAHVPQAVPQLIRPEPLEVTTQKFPLNVRQYYVNSMHNVCVQIYTNAEDAAQRAVKEEFACHERCKALAVYKNSCMLATYRLRKEVDQSLPMESVVGATTPGSSMVSHEAVLAGKAKGSWSVLKTKRSVTKFTGTALYTMLKKWILSEQQLRDNGFPRPHPDGQKGRAKVYVTNSRNQNALSKVPNERICSRCGCAYAIDKQGFQLRPQNCIYHWGKKFTVRGEGKYSCCQQYGSATGCCDAKTHVWDYVDYENLRGYVKTLPKDISIEEQGVYSLDCEMSYTTQGLELTRVTVIDEDCNVVYEALVKPQNPIIDYNTRFSGITEENMKNVTTSLLDVQATLLTMFSEKTILVGHSLESDFKALRLLHDTVVDTSVMFPHKNGYPQKRALKNLCSEYLRKIIQNEVCGHDSKEDAVSCMELILWKAKEVAKLQ
ncbi:uncharacterized protein LOC117229499 [Megalopta genalis]|uniref:uncharacterized protein LOC117229499 n=1 Tax=Megalopta genalis TaxID=115081 RepID=UPI003FD221D9